VLFDTLLACIADEGVNEANEYGVKNMLRSETAKQLGSSRIYDVLRLVCERGKANLIKFILPHLTVPTLRQISVEFTTGALGDQGKVLEELLDLIVLVRQGEQRIESLACFTSGQLEQSSRLVKDEYETYKEEIDAKRAAFKEQPWCQRDDSEEPYLFRTFVHGDDGK
jgi:hypothetical protein